MNTTASTSWWVGGLLWLLTGVRPVAAQIYYIDLSQQTLTLPQRTFYVDQVLDGRQDRAGIGQVHEDLRSGNSQPRLPSKTAEALSSVLTGSHSVNDEPPRPAELKPNLVDGLTAFLRTQLPARPGDEPLLLLVRDLRVGEQGGGSPGMSNTMGMPYAPGVRQQALARVTLDCYLHRLDGYHLLRTVTDTTMRKRGDATTLHAGNLALALEHCLSQLTSPDWVAAVTRPGRPLAELQRVGHSAGTDPKYAVLTDSVRPRGYYPTFLDFRNNRPVTTPTLLVETQVQAASARQAEAEVLPLLTTDKGPRALSGVWGFSDGQQQYIYQHGHFALLHRAGASFGFQGIPDAEQELRLLGTVLASNHVQPVPFTLDLVSGRVTQFADAGRAAATRDTIMLYVYRPRGKNAAPYRLLLNERFVGELADNSFLALPWADQEHEPHLRLEGVAGPELKFIPSFQRPVYIKFEGKTGADAAQPALERVPAKEGEFALREIRLRQQVELKKRSRAQP